MEVTNRFKGLDLIDRVPEGYGWRFMTLYRRPGIKTITMEKKCKKAKWLSEEALEIVVKGRKVKSKEKRKDMPI